MTILVTGANGLIGSHVVRSLLKRDYAVRAFVREGADLRNLDGLNVELVRGDLLRPGSIVDAATGCKAIFRHSQLVSVGISQVRLDGVIRPPRCHSSPVGRM